jgi:lipocalin
VKATYGKTNVTGRISVNNYCRKGSVNGTVSLIQGYAVASPTNPANLTVYFSGFGSAYEVLHIEGDYQQSILYGCSSLGPINVQFLWILSRTPTITNYEYLSKLALKLSGLKTLVPTVQAGCTYQRSVA